MTLENFGGDSPYNKLITRCKKSVTVTISAATDDLCNVGKVPGLELSQLPSKSVLTKKTRWKFLLYCALLIYKIIYLLMSVHVCDHHISIKSSCC